MPAEVVQAILEASGYIAYPADRRRPGSTWGRAGGSTWGGRRVSVRAREDGAFVLAGVQPLADACADPQVGRIVHAWVILLRWGMDHYTPEGTRERLAAQLLALRGARRFVGCEEWGARGTVIAIPNVPGVNLPDVMAAFRQVSRELSAYGLETTPALSRLEPRPPVQPAAPAPAADEPAGEDDDEGVSHTTDGGPFGRALLGVIRARRRRRSR